MEFDVSPFSVNEFYGRQAVRNRRHKKANYKDWTNLKSSVASRWPKEFPFRLLGPTVCWRTFYRQSEAFEFAKHFAEDVYIFAFESATDPTLNKGQRKYLATSLPVFWHYYSQLPDTRKAHYEIIPEGAPCKLYFDLEFQRNYNPSSNGTKMTAIFVRFVCLWLNEYFGINVDRSHVLDLDASTSIKFSRHLIFQLPGAVFENNVTAGKFVHFITAILIHHLERLSSLSTESVMSPEVSSHLGRISPMKDMSQRNKENITCVRSTTDISSLSENIHLMKDMSVIHGESNTCISSTIAVSSPSERICPMKDMSKINGESMHACMSSATKISSLSGRISPAKDMSEINQESISCVSSTTEVTSPSGTICPVKDMSEINRKNSTCVSSAKMEELYMTEKHNSILVTDSSKHLEDFMKKDNETFEPIDSFSKEDNILNRKSIGPSLTPKHQQQDTSLQGCPCSKTCSCEQNSLVSHVDCFNNSLSPRKIENEAVWTEKDAISFCNEKSQKILSLFSEEDLRSLLIRKKDGELTPFCDLGVYTRNRNFRLFLSSKLNKKNPLVIAKENAFKPASGYDTFECDIFYASLVSHNRISEGTSILSSDGHIGVKSIQRNSEETQRKFKSDVVSHADTLEGRNCISPYPEVDEFIMSLVASNGDSGSIRHWTYFIHRETLVYDIVGYRWCGNIGRQHKSNNIMYVADFRQGVYYQKCYDPDCQAIQYKSPECPLPASVLPGYYFPDDDTQNTESDVMESEDEFLIAAVEDVELLQVLDATTPSNP